MNFTREPIIETIISPADGYKLAIRNSKEEGKEEYLVDAVEIVSFGSSFFFRSLEKPKEFLVPVSDYEVIETKEVRASLKNVPYEKTIKIGGGREPQPQPQPRAREVEQEEETIEKPAADFSQGERKGGRDRRRRHRRGGGRANDERPEYKSDAAPVEATVEGGDAPHDEIPISSSTFATLFPPPPVLVSKTIARYKDLLISEGTDRTKPVEEPPLEKPVILDEES